MATPRRRDGERPLRRTGGGAQAGDDYLDAGQGDGSDALTGRTDGSSAGDKCVLFSDSADTGVDGAYLRQADRPLLMFCDSRRGYGLMTRNPSNVT